jgi:hypothetical protein
MREHEDKICAHPACKCPVEKGTKYCSTYCEDAGDEMQEISCNCGHAGCAVSDAIPVMSAPIPA